MDHYISLYAATKKANELMAHTYSHLFNVPTTCLRFFTVYVPWRRPDMALFLFTKGLLEGNVIEVLNRGQTVRDLIFTDDIVEGVVRVLDKPASHAAEAGGAPYRVVNIGNDQPTPLMADIEAIEKALGRVAVKNYLPMQLGDVPATFADTDALGQWVGFKPSTAVELGVQRFVDWYQNYYSVSATAAS